MTRLIAFVVGALLSIYLVIAHAQTAREWPTYPIKQAPAELRAAIQRADLVVVAIQNATSVELTGALSSGGPGDAIQICHLSATALTQRLGRVVDEAGLAGRLRLYADRVAGAVRLRRREYAGPG